jgi:hypothetical protein
MNCKAWERKELAFVLYTGYNACDVWCLVTEVCHYAGIHNPDGGLEIIWQSRPESPKQKAIVPIGSVVIENRRGGISVMSEVAFKNEYQSCC